MLDTISILLNFLRLLLWSSMWFILENFACAGEKNVYSAVFDTVYCLSIYISYFSFICVFVVFEMDFFLYIYILYIYYICVCVISPSDLMFFFFLAMPAACGSSWARNQMCAAAAAQATAVAMLDPSPAAQGNSLMYFKVCAFLLSFCLDNQSFDVWGGVKVLYHYCVTVNFSLYVH